MSTDDEAIRYGYWPHRRMSGDIPSPIRDVSEYTGADVLNIACTQTGLSVSSQKKLVNDWAAELPRVPAKTIVFSTKVSQQLFNAACSAPNLEALYIDWSAMKSLEAVEHASRMKALFLGSSPSIASLRPLESLDHLECLFLQNPGSPVDLGFLNELTSLREFGLSSARGRKIGVSSLEPVGSLASLEILWLVGVKVLDGRYCPLHKLHNLKSLRSTLNADSTEFRELCAALPSIKYFHPVG